LKRQKEAERKNVEVLDIEVSVNNRIIANDTTMSKGDEIDFNQYIS
jgi:molybdopterin converting factor small subunit